MQSSTARTEALRGNRSIIAISPKQSPSFRVRRRYSRPPQDFSTRGYARFENEHRIGLVVLAEKELARRNGDDWAQSEQVLEDIGPDSTENGHVLQEFDPRFLHGGTS